MNFTLGGNKIDLFNPSFGAVLVIGVVHGDEQQGDYLIRKYYELCPETKLMLVPCLNPDGMESKTRTNFRGVDLNRNFPSKNWILSETLKKLSLNEHNVLNEISLLGPFK